MNKLVRYTSLEESGDDTAYGLFTSERYPSCYIAVSIGPGFDPCDPHNRPGFVWGRVDYFTSMDSHNQAVEDGALGYNTQFLGRFPSDLWKRRDAVIRRMRKCLRDWGIK